MNLYNVVSILVLFLWTKLFFVGKGSGYCYNARQCMDDTGYELSNLYCYGYESCVNLMNASISTIGYCNGAESCMNITEPGLSSPKYINCFGYKSCVNSFLWTMKDVWCYGQASCQNSNIMVSTRNGNDLFNNMFTIECYGLSSCSFAVINSSHDSNDIDSNDSNVASVSINGYSTYALYSGMIDATKMKLNLYLYGYLSGYNLTIICGSSSQYTCDIYCNSINSCFNINIICLNDDYCNIYGINNNSFILDNFEYNEYNIGLNSILQSECLNINSSDANGCDDYAECKNDVLTSELVCCEADSSCAQSKMTANILGCDGQRSCYQSDILLSNYNNGSVIYCTGYESCCCSSSIAVVWSKNGNENNGRVECNGYQSCHQTTINDTDTVSCNGYASCDYVTIKGVSNIYIYGFEATGSHTRIDSDDSGMEMNIYFCNDINFYYKNSIEMANIYCYDNDICNIYCINSESCADFSINYCADSEISNDTYCDNVNIIGFASNETKFVASKCAAFAPLLPLYNPINMENEYNTTLTAINDTGIIQHNSHDDSTKTTLIACAAVIAILLIFATALLIQRKRMLKKQIYSQIDGTKDDFNRMDIQ